MSPFPRLAQYDPVKGKEDYEALGVLTAGDLLYLDRILHKDCAVDMHRRRVWFTHIYGQQGGEYGWREYLELLGAGDDADARDNKKVSPRLKNFDPLVYAVPCPVCGAQPMKSCRRVVDQEDSAERPSKWAKPHSGRRKLATERYGTTTGT